MDTDIWLQYHCELFVVVLPWFVMLMFFTLLSVLIDMWNQLRALFVSDFNYSAEGIMIRNLRSSVIAVSWPYNDITDDVVELICGARLGVTTCSHLDVCLLESDHIQFWGELSNVVKASVEVASNDYIPVHVLGICMLDKDGESILCWIGSTRWWSIVRDDKNLVLDGSTLTWR